MTLKGEGEGEKDIGLLSNAGDIESCIKFVVSTLTVIDMLTT